MRRFGRISNAVSSGNPKANQSAYQIVESEVAQLRRLNSKVLERLRSRVNLLVDKLALHLVGRHGVPPEKLVEVVGSRLHQDLGNIEMAAVLDDLAVNQLGNLRHGVVLRAVQLKSLTSRGVIMQHALESSSDIERLTISYIRIKRCITYVDRPEALLQVVGGQEIGCPGEFVKEIVFEAERGGWSDNGGFGVDIACHFFSPSLFQLDPFYFRILRLTLVEKNSEGESLLAL